MQTGIGCVYTQRVDRYGWLTEGVKRLSVETLGLFDLSNGIEKNIESE